MNLIQYNTGYYFRFSKEKLNDFSIHLSTLFNKVSILKIFNATSFDRSV